MAKQTDNKHNNDDKALASGWWILPLAVAGLIVWGLIGYQVWKYLTG